MNEDHSWALRVLERGFEEWSFCATGDAHAEQGLTWFEWGLGLDELNVLRAVGEGRSDVLVND